MGCVRCCHRSPSRQSRRDTDSEDEGSIKKLVGGDTDSYILLILSAMLTLRLSAKKCSVCDGISRLLP